MDLLVGLLSLALGLFGLGVGRSHHRHVIERLREQARLSAIESQMAALRAALRIQAAEHIVRQRMQAEQHRLDPFANTTLHEEPEEWRS